MPLSTEQYNRIMRFLDGEMSLPEMEAFELELQQVPEMRAQLNFEQSIRNSFSLQEVQPAKKIPAVSKWLALAAAVLALALFIPFLFNTSKNKTANNTEKPLQQQPADSLPKMDSSVPIPPLTKENKSVKSDLLNQLFKQFYTKDTVPEEYPVMLAQAFEDYEAGNYTTFQQLNMEELPTTRSNREASIRPLAQYFKGLSHLQAGNAREAIQNLQWVAGSQPDTSLQEKANWYLILAYLKENKREQAHTRCISLQQRAKNPELKTKAKQLLDLLNKNK